MNKYFKVWYKIKDSKKDINILPISDENALIKKTLKDSKENSFPYKEDINVKKISGGTSLVGRTLKELTRFN